MEEIRGEFVTPAVGRRGGCKTHRRRRPFGLTPELFLNADEGEVDIGGRMNIPNLRGRANITVQLVSKLEYRRITFLIFETIWFLLWQCIAICPPYELEGQAVDRVNIAGCSGLDVVGFDGLKTLHLQNTNQGRKQARSSSTMAHR